MNRQNKKLLGRFTEVNERDDFSEYSRPTTSPSFPGEDFLRNAPPGFTFPLDLTTGSSTIIMTIEPELGGLDPVSVDPFQVELFRTIIPKDAPLNTPLQLTRSTEVLPQGTVSY